MEEMTLDELKQVDVYKRQIFAFWNDSPNHFMVVFATAFLIWSTGITIKHFCTRISLSIEFNSRRVRKLTSVVRQ